MNSEISVDDLSFFIKSFNSMTSQKISTMNSATKQKMEQFLDIITKYAEFPIAYSMIYSNVVKSYQNSALEPGTIGSFLWGSVSENRINYIGSAKDELLNYVVNSKNKNSTNVCSILGAGSISKNEETYCSVPVIYYDGISLVPLLSKFQESVSSSLFGITPRTFKNINSSSSNSDKSFRVHRDDCILYLPIYVNNNSNITVVSESNSNKKYTIPLINFDMISQLVDYGVNQVSVFLYEPTNDGKYNVFYSGKYNLGRKKYIEIDLPDELVNVNIGTLKFHRAPTQVKVKDKVKNLTTHIIIIIIIAILLIYLISKGFNYYQNK